MILFLLTTTLLMSAVVAQNIVTLTLDNYAEVTDGKSVFVRFFAPWCGNSKRMEPDWIQLGKDWKGNKNTLIADVDCTGDDVPLCDRHGVDAFPALKYGDPFDLEEYKGPRAYEAMSEFAKEFVKPDCTPNNRGACSKEEKKLMKQYQKFSKDEIKQRIKEDKTKLKQLRKEYEAQVDKMGAEYEKLVEAKEQRVGEIVNGDLKYMIAIQKARAKGVNNPVKDESSKDEL